MEYSLLVNDKDELAIANLIDIFIEAIRINFQLSYLRRDFLVLESNNPNKASYHIIARKFDDNGIPLLFENNLTCGEFIKSLVDKLYKSYEANAPLFDKFVRQTIRSLFKATEKGMNEKIIIDTGIYTRNRQFRMFGSCKFGRLDDFKLSRINEFQHNSSSTQELINISLAGYYQFHDENFLGKLLQPSGQSIQSTSRTTNLPPVTDNEKTDLQVGSDQLRQVYRHFFKQMSKPGDVRSVVLLQDETFRINFTSAYKYCANVGRSHRNNNIYIIFDQKNLNYQQKCLHPDCRNFSTGKLPVIFVSSPSTTAPLSERRAAIQTVGTGAIIDLTSTDSSFFAVIEVSVQPTSILLETLKFYY